jgi:hypothetical protein
MALYRRPHRRRRVPSRRRADGAGDTRAMERAVLVWFLGVPVPVLTLVWLFGGFH